MERTTRQKTAIQAAIESAQRPLSAQEILEQASLQVRQLGIATVYRNLKSLVLEERVHVVTLPGENPRYESNAVANHHHHHFQCTTCQRPAPNVWAALTYPICRILKAWPRASRT